jgi:transcriptional regulator with XRE-family HTH domain
MTEQTAVLPAWTLGDRLRKAREFAGLEQGELADRVGISRSTVSNYELGRGVRPPKWIVIRAWAHECGVPLDWLVEDTPFAARLAEAGAQPDNRQEARGNTRDESQLVAAA